MIPALHHQGLILSNSKPYMAELYQQLFVLYGNAIKKSVWYLSGTDGPKLNKRSSSQALQVSIKIHAIC